MSDAAKGNGPEETPGHFLAFAEFHTANPDVYNTLVEMTRELKQKGHTKVGIGMLFEVMRWQHMRAWEKDEMGFKLNHNFRSYYARLIMADEPDLDGIFEIRQLRS